MFYGVLDWYFYVVNLCIIECLILNNMFDECVVCDYVILILGDVCLGYGDYGFVLCIVVDIV